MPGFLRDIKKAVTGVEQGLLEQEIQSYKSYGGVLQERQLLEEQRLERERELLKQQELERQREQQELERQREQQELEKQRELERSKVPEKVAPSSVHQPQGMNLTSPTDTSGAVSSFKNRFQQMRASPTPVDTRPTVGETAVSRVDPPQQLRSETVRSDVTSSFKARLREGRPDALNHDLVNKLITDVVSKHSQVSDNRKLFSFIPAKHKESKEEYLKNIEGIKANKEFTPEQKLERFTKETERYMNKLAQGKSERYLDNLREAIGMEKLNTPQQFEQAWKKQGYNLNEVLCKKMGVEPSTIPVQDTRTFQVNPSVS